MHTAHDLLLAALFCSVVFFSFGFLAIAFYINRAATKKEREAEEQSANSRRR